MAGSISRRRFLGTGAVTGAAGLVAAGSTADGAAASAPQPATPFHGPHQAGVLDPPAPVAAVAAFDVIAADRAGLVDLFKTLTNESRILTTAGPAPDSGPAAPPADNGVLGQVIPV